MVILQLPQNNQNGNEKAVKLDSISMVGVDPNMASHVHRLMTYAALFITSRCTRLTVYSHLADSDHATWLSRYMHKPQTKYCGPPTPGHFLILGYKT